MRSPSPRSIRDWRRLHLQHRPSLTILGRPSHILMLSLRVSGLRFSDTVWLVIATPNSNQTTCRASKPRFPGSMSCKRTPSWHGHLHTWCFAYATWQRTLNASLFPRACKQYAATWQTAVSILLHSRSDTLTRSCLCFIC